ncbi:MAG: prolyl oligopeptidase family serine peptidase [Lachnospiraceae bacterium]|nr:prolyl oligopeptidase family serine peptidase [Lachnospiraceae bacterium]
MVKKLVGLTMVGALSFSLAACGSSDSGSATAESEAEATETTEEVSTEETETSTETEEAAAEGTTTDGDSVSGTYDIFITGYDWGAGVNEVTLNLDSTLDSVSAEDFAVTETKQTTDWTSENFDIIETTVDRQVTDAYFVDADGNKSEDPTENVKLELYVSPNDGSPFLFSMTTQFNTYSNPYYLTITSSDSAAFSLDIAQEYVNKETSADNWSVDSYEATDGVKYDYAYFNPETDTDTLVVWLHGMGEGGTTDTDPYVTILANKVTALASDEFQSTVGGAYVVAPQCPTYWMDNDGQMGNLATGIGADGTSFYLNSLEEFIDSYAEKVGAEKIVIAGCSNGGFMTMLLSLSRPDAYACAVPICEALSDELISDEGINSLMDLPMYFIYSEDDTTVDPTVFEIPTIERLKAAGKTSDTLHVSTTESVIDTSGQYTDEEGNPYQYMGHWSWIYFDNNESVCNDDGLTAWDFIAESVK